MTVTTLQDRIAKAEERITKKTNTITKKQALMVKKQGLLEKTTDDWDRYWTECEIGHLEEDIERLQKEIIENTKKIEEYKLQMAGVMERESVLNDIPDNMKKLQSDLVEIWDEYDKQRRQFMTSEYSRLGYKEFYKKYTHSDSEFRFKSDEEIHKANIKDAKDLILDLIYRVKDITGEITSWKGIRAEQGTHGFTVLNGCVEGKQGRAVIESILAGGYNIQRLHIRVLVKEY